MRKIRSDLLKNRASVVRLSLRGLTPKQISKQLHLSEQRVYLHLKAAKVKPTKLERKGPLSNRRRVLDLVKKEGVAKAAERLKVSRQAVYQRLRKWDAA